MSMPSATTESLTAQPVPAEVAGGEDVLDRSVLRRLVVHRADTGRAAASTVMHVIDTYFQ